LGTILAESKAGDPDRIQVEIPPHLVQPALVEDHHRLEPPLEYVPSATMRPVEPTSIACLEPADCLAEVGWDSMMRYLEVPEAELDNNLIEHALRSVVMGRRNWLHVGQEVGGERAANLFTLMGTCRRLGVEPYEYLCDIVPRLGRHPQKDIWELTPRGWRDVRAKAVVQVRS